MKLFVGNLSWGLSENDLYNLFSSYGQIDECRLILDRETGRSRGFGFVTFNSADAAKAAEAELNGKEVDGRPLKVNEANEMKPRTGGGGFRRNNRRDNW